MTGNGRPDAVVNASNKLWLYANCWSTPGSPAVAAPAEIGSAGWAPMTITAPGDADRAGSPDLLVRDTRDGILYPTGPW
ncbi:hypothetical protein [Streptomyces globisporus]|uniref:hypothetical protein n=1 Tax=Streptomyces globisporus TaxID=1908 RepID=UPI0036B69FF6